MIKYAYAFVGFVGFIISFTTSELYPTYYPKGASDASGFIFLVGIALLAFGFFGVLSDLDIREHGIFWAIALSSILILGAFWAIVYSSTNPMVYQAKQHFNDLTPLLRFDIAFGAATFGFCLMFPASFVNYYFTYYFSLLSFWVLRQIYRFLAWSQLRTRPDFRMKGFERKGSLGQKVTYQFIESFLSGFWLLIILTYFLPSSYFETAPMGIVPKVFTPMLYLIFPLTILLTYPLCLLEALGTTANGSVVSPKKLHKFWSALAAIAFIAKLITQGIEILPFTLGLVLYSQLLLGFSMSYTSVEKRLIRKMYKRFSSF